jgi:hypothetical protein
MPDPARLHCLLCGSSRLRLLLNLSIEDVPHGAPGHVFTFGYNLVAVCDACGHGQLEKYSHDCFHYEGDEDWDMYWWYAFTPDDVARLRNRLAQCPDPLNAACACALHQSLRSSSLRLWGGVTHAVNPAGSVTFAWAALEEQADRVLLKLDEARGPLQGHGMTASPG